MTSLPEDFWIYNTKLKTYGGLGSIHYLNTET